VLIFIILISVVVLLTQQTQAAAPTYSEVVDYFDSEQVQSFVVEGNVLKLVLKDNTVLEHELLDVGIFYTDLAETIKQQYNDGVLTVYDYQPGMKLRGG
jgi:hypothetical protein